MSVHHPDSVLADVAMTTRYRVKITGRETELTAEMKESAYRSAGAFELGREIPDGVEVVSISTSFLVTPVVDEFE